VMSEAFFGLSIGPDCGGPLVVVNVWDRISVERWIFTAAHELGHLLLHPDSYDVDKTNENEVEEQEANIFASYFLMPQAVFEREWQDTRGLPFLDRVLKVKRMFRVSYKTVLYRISETMNPSGNVWLQFQLEHNKRYGKTLKKADEPQPASTDKFMASYSEVLPAYEPEKLSKTDFIPDRLARLVRQALEDEIISLSHAADMMGVDTKSMRSITLSWAGNP
jgi:Zn-dependent peptidase ImmA (M78 family)